MAKNDTAYNTPSKPDTAFGKPGKPDTAHGATAKPESAYTGNYPNGISYNEPDVTYDSAIVNYNGSSKMNREHTSYSTPAKNETAFA